MKNSFIFKAATFFLSIGVCLFFIINFKEKNANKNNSEEPGPEIKIIYEDPTPIQNLSLEEKIYSIEYERGRRAFLGQMGIIIKNKKEKAIDFDYTKMEKEEVTSEDEKAKYEEIKNKAYVDGYHKAAENFVCPRNN